MSKKSMWALVVCIIAALAVTACGSSKKDNSSSSASASTSTSTTSSSGGKGAVAVLLPDTKSSVRWETEDRPELDKALTQAWGGVDVDLSTDLEHRVVARVIRRQRQLHADLPFRR